MRHVPRFLLQPADNSQCVSITACSSQAVACALPKPAFAEAPALVEAELAVDTQIVGTTAKACTPVPNLAASSTGFVLKGSTVQTIEKEDLLAIEIKKCEAHQLSKKSAKSAVTAAPLDLLAENSQEVVYGSAFAHTITEREVTTAAKAEAPYSR